MDKLYQDYKDIAEFYLVYITEAHAVDDKYPVGYAKELGIREHTSYGERCTVAERLLGDKALTIPCLVDNMDNAVQDAYKAWPTRVFLVRMDGRLGVAAGRGPWGYVPALKETEKWLAEFRETGSEPPLPEVKEGATEESEADRTGGQWQQQAAKVGELTQELMELAMKGDHEQALEVALQAVDHAKSLHKQAGAQAAPMVSMTNYNAACMYSLMKRKDKAFEHLRATVDAGSFGGDLAEQIQSDADFDNIRDDPRYAEIIKKAGE